jgi:hypothetical protein
MVGDSRKHSGRTRCYRSCDASADLYPFSPSDILASTMMIRAFVVSESSENFVESGRDTLLPEEIGNYLLAEDDTRKRKKSKG